ncbi:MAG: hypothetical protein K6D91_07600 [Prevotella sp.]|nr:hypothetical protein [Prevotella sp.]
MAIIVFDNGNVISSQIYTKSVDGNSVLGHRLTTQCPIGQEDNPLLFPGWRGVKDDWFSYGLTVDASYAPNLAIRGLFTPLSDTEKAALEAEGYNAQDWGKTLIENRDEYEKYLFYEYDCESAPIHYWPFTPNVLSNGGFANGYGFKNQ